MELICQLHSHITSSTSDHKTIQLIPGDQVEIVAAHDNGNLEIGLTKKTYLALFKQCHLYWHSKDSRSPTLDTYLMTLGYMVTTNENTTIIALHDTVTAQLYQEHGEEFLLREIDIISTYLSSRLKKINKSSSLWSLMKRYTVLIAEKYPDVLKTVVLRAWQSCQVHFANYYAANYLKWCFQVGILHREALETLQQLCHKNLRDVSLWNLQYEALLSVGGLRSQYSINEHNRLAKDSKYWSVQPRTPILAIDDPEWVRSEIIRQFEWLLQIECSIRTPYVTLINAEERIGGEADGLLDLASNKSSSVRKEIGSTNGSEGSVTVKRMEFCQVLETLWHLEAKGR
ncbi:uncharacterized protein CANTADRAFT_110209 [Suhomyces tanzawaensis NRRL Y-17324]|uniref:Uncharacterized protein n=1 Tax=Suhomyces tanzawaensis NRRL Y-17324 TaxID=984487 RepID=A0A1E4SPN7_9ASCO|nr:uncharacterized protein CANTADRAFT_110209 [Suhomyces tanzawaensis NRRL Y-17324]ODV81490.1 hypothetical protein CANTADRAFT_110209 [Suhomyces tanzawaensis NRRL Y-17324]